MRLRDRLRDAWFGWRVGVLVPAGDVDSKAEPMAVRKAPSYDPEREMYGRDPNPVEAAYDGFRRFAQAARDGKVQLVIECDAYDGAREVIELDANQAAAYVECGSPEARARYRFARIRERRLQIARDAVRRMREASLSVDDLSGIQEAALREFGAVDAQGRLREDFGTAWDTADYLSTPYLDQEWLPYGQGPLGYQLYLADMWEQLAKAWWAWHHDPLAKQGINIVVNFVLAGGVRVSCDNEQTQAVVDEFWQRETMDMRLRAWVTDLGRDGELFAHLIPDGSGKMRARSCDPTTIWEIMTDAVDIERVYGYAQRYMCLDGDTRISLLNGTEPTIRELAERHGQTGESFAVYSFDLAAKKIVPGIASAAVRSGEKRCVRIQLDNGESIVASFDHPFLTRDGQYVWAERLVPGQSLMPLYRRTGYEQLWQPESGWKYTHQEIAEAIGLERNGRHIDHIDGNRRNNDPRNLQSLTPGEHCRKTWDTVGVTERRSSSIKRIAAARTKRKSYKLSAATRAKIAAKQLEHWGTQTPEQIGERMAKITATRLGWSDERRKEASRRISLARASRFEHSAAAQSVNHKVLSVTDAGIRDVYDLTVDKYENFAVSAGVFVHNTRTQLVTLPDVDSQKWVERNLSPTNTIHVKINATSSEVRGRSDLFAILGYLKRLRDYFTSEVLKAQAAAAYHRDVSIDGSDADVQAFAAQEAQQGEPQPGETWYHNDAVKISMVQGGNRTPAANGSVYAGLVNLIACGLGITKEYLGVTEHASLASASVSEEPAFQTIEVRQQIVHDLVERIVKRVIDEAQRFGRLPADAARAFAVTFRGIRQDDKNKKLDRLALGEGMGWWSKETAATQAAPEAGIADFSFDDEQDKIAGEHQAVIMKTYEQVPKGYPTLTQPAFAPGSVPNPDAGATPAPSSNGKAAAGNGKTEARERGIVIIP